MAWPFLIGLLFAAAVGVRLLIMGLRGRVIDDHPLCSQCGFDLTGKPDTSTRCAECGQDLEWPDSIRIGHRVRRAGLLWTGIGLLVPSLLLAGLMVWTTLDEVDTNPWKPAWLLTWQAGSNDQAARDSAMDELIRRLKANGLSKGTVDSIVANAMRRQLNPSLAWSTGWGSFVQAAYAIGKISKETYVTFARQGLKLGLVVRPTVYSGDAVPMQIEAATLTRGPVTAAFGISWGNVSIDGVLTKNLPKQIGAYSYSDGGGVFTSTPLRDITGEMTASLPLGAHRVKGILHVQILDPNSSYAGRTLGEYDVALNADVTLISRDTKIEYFKIDESLRNAVEASVEAPWITQAANGKVLIEFTIHSGPVALAHQALIRTPDGREVSLDQQGRFDVQANRPNHRHSQNASANVELRGAKTVDLILRPDLDIARQSVDPSPRWGDEIIIRDIPIRSQPRYSMNVPATMPAR